MAKKRGLSTQVAKDALSTLFKKPVTQKYPFVPANVVSCFRGKQVLDLEKCIGCSLCAKDCPANAIEMVMVGGKKRPMIYLDRCVFCYQCADSCPRNVFQTSKVFELAAIDKSTLVIKPQAPVTAASAPPVTQPAPASATPNPSPPSESSQ